VFEGAVGAGDEAALVAGVRADEGGSVDRAEIRGAAAEVEAEVVAERRGRRGGGGGEKREDDEG
jgi:hypothetical protein